MLYWLYLTYLRIAISEYHLLGNTFVTEECEAQKNKCAGPPTEKYSRKINNEAIKLLSVKQMNSKTSQSDKSTQ